MTYRIPATDHGWHYDDATGGTCCQYPAGAHETNASPRPGAPAPQPLAADPIGEAAHAVWDALDLATAAANRDPEAPEVLEAADHPILVDDGTWGILAVWGTTPVRITVELARPEEAEALGFDPAALGFPPAPADGGPPAARNHGDYGELACTECGEGMFLTGTGVAHHAGDGPSGIDHDADAAHVALAPDGAR